MQKQSPRVSVLISSYNGKRFIGAAIDSALAQTEQNIEVVVIDAGSTDGTPELVRAYADPRVRYIQHGYEPIKATRNALLREGRGAYLTFLDSDDIYLPEKVAAEAAYLDAHPEDAAVYCDLRYFFDGEPAKLYRHRYTFHAGDILPQLLDKMFITNTTLMLRRTVVEKLGGYDEKLGLVEDWAYFLRMAHAGYRFGFLPQDLVRYRLRWDNHTSFKNQVPIQGSAVAIFEDLSARMTPAEREKYRMDAHIARRRENLVLALLAEGKKQEARRAWSAVPRRLRSPKFKLAIPVMLLLPSAVLHFTIEQAWKFKKKNLFVPA